MLVLYKLRSLHLMSELTEMRVIPLGWTQEGASGLSFWAVPVG